MTISKIDTFAYKLLGEKLARKSADYIDLQQNLIHARMGIPFDAYLSRVYLVSIMAAIPLSIVVYFLLAPSLSAVFGIAALALLPLLMVLLGFIVYNLLLAYPGIVANLRGRNIEIGLPHAVALMHALSRGNSDIISFFNIIGKNKKLYGEVSDEANGILLDVKMFNRDVESALKDAGTRSPSESFRNLVESLSTVVTTGGDLVAFFLSKSEQYRLKALNENKAFMEMLGLLSEVYVTGFAAGPLFIITLLVVLGIVGGENFFILNMVTYLMIPGGAILFIVLLSSITGEHEEILETPELKKKEENIILQRADLRFSVFQFMQNPLLKLIEKPEMVLYFSVPPALLFFLFSTYTFFGLQFEQLIYEVDDYIIFSTLIAFVPYSIFMEIHARRIKKIIGSFPELLNRLVSFHESGLTIAKSVSKLRFSELGVLDSEVRKMNSDIEWSGSVVEAFKNFGARVKTLSALRVATLLESASRMTGNIKDTLAIAATDAFTNKTLLDERKTAMKMQLIIIYISFFIFLYVVQSLVSGFLPQIQTVPAGGEEAAALIGEGIKFSEIDKPLYVRLFFHSAVLVGFFSGLVAGQISEGDARLGLKHSIVMVLIAYGVFSLIS